MLRERKTILILCPDPELLGEMHQWLKEDYHCVPMRTLKDISLYLEQKGAHLLICDGSMSATAMGVFLEALAEHPQGAQLPILLVASPDLPQLHELLGNPKFAQILLLPLHGVILRQAVQQQLELYELRQRSDLIIEEATAAIRGERDLLMGLFANLAEYRDQAQGNHILRTQACVHKLIVGYNALFPDRAIDPETAGLIILGSQLHDIGKICTPDSVLLKPGRLTPEEFDIMKRHTVQGSRALTNPYAGQTPRFLEIAQQIAMNHHEKWDGTGYPQGLRGEQIPLPARIVTVVDVLDALMSLRPYRQPLTYEQATQSIVEGRGTHFDPDLVDAFLNQSNPIREIYMGYQDDA